MLFRSNDYDLDGAGEFAISDICEGAVHVVRRSALGNYEVVQTVPVGSGARRMVSSDFTGDAVEDVVVVNSWQDNLSLLRNRGLGCGG